MEKKGDQQAALITANSFGSRAADRLAKYAGSWTFIIGFMIFLIIWMILNTAMIFLGEWDPYPFILLNLVLSCLAALQAPVILMSQNRQTEKDRRKAEYDYKVNRKAERGIEEILTRLRKLEGNVGKNNKVVRRK